MNRLDDLLSKYPIMEQAWVPKPFRSDLEWAVAKALVAEPKLQRNIPEETLPMDDIEPTQSRLDHGKVQQLADDGVVDGGLAFRDSNGVIHLWDGHHRHFAAQSLGHEERTIKVFDLTHDPAGEGMSLKDWSSQLGVRVPSILKNMDSDDHRRYEYQDHHEG